MCVCVAAIFQVPAVNQLPSDKIYYLFVWQLNEIGKDYIAIL